MKGFCYLSDLITDPGMLRPGRINIIEANTSAGKTWFALNTIPEWAGSPEKVLYLIDTTNGELRLQQNILTISRQNYALADYASGALFGEFADDARDKMPVMTYAGFGSEIRNSGHSFWEKFEYIVCDEMQNLVHYQGYGSKELLMLAETTLRSIAAKGRTKIVALSATPQKIRERLARCAMMSPLIPTNSFNMRRRKPFPIPEWRPFCCSPSGGPEFSTPRAWLI